MDVFLIPTSTSDEYELYYEAPDTDAEETEEARGFFGKRLQRIRRRFSAMLAEAEEWRHKRDLGEAPPARGLLSKAKHKVMGFIVERIAEQRLLWHMRTTVTVCAQIPGDLTEQDADTIIRGMLKKDHDHHFKWIWIDLVLLILTAPLMVIPGPNVPGFYFTFQVVGHFLSWQGAKRGLGQVQWTIKPNPALTELRALLAPTVPHRTRRIHELAERLRLQHFATFFEEVAAPTA